MNAREDRPDNRSEGQKFRDDEWAGIEFRGMNERLARHIEVNMHYLTGEYCPKCSSPMFRSDQGKPDYCSLCRWEKRPGAVMYQVVSK
jgi:hypothetical protein